MGKSSEKDSRVGDSIGDAKNERANAEAEAERTSSSRLSQETRQLVQIRWERTYEPHGEHNTGRETSQLMLYENEIWETAIPSGSTGQ